MEWLGFFGKECKPKSSQKQKELETFILTIYKGKDRKVLPMNIPLAVFSIFYSCIQLFANKGID